MTALLIIGWLACGVAGYVLARRHFRRLGRRWTLSDRIAALAVTVFTGPLFFALGLYYELSDVDWDRPVKW